MNKRVRFVCPRNGERTRCEVDQLFWPHKREELAFAGTKPRCETHALVLVPAR